MITSIVLINLLIATMSDTFARVQSKAQAEYIYVKYSRMRLYYHRPAPILDAPSCILRMLRRTVDLLSRFVSISRAGTTYARSIDAVALGRGFSRSFSAVHLVVASKAAGNFSTPTPTLAESPQEPQRATSTSEVASARSTTPEPRTTLWWAASGWGSVKKAMLFQEELLSAQEADISTMVDGSGVHADDGDAQSSALGRMPTAKFNAALQQCGATSARRSVASSAQRASLAEKSVPVRASMSADGHVAEAGTASSDGQMIARRFLQTQAGHAEQTPHAVTSSTRDLLKVCYGV